MIRIGAAVELVTFQGEVSAPEDCDRAENYWKLIGERGTVRDVENSGKRVLVVFENDVASQGLHCHNEVPNSLYLKGSDLRVVS